MVVTSLLIFLALGLAFGLLLEQLMRRGLNWQGILSGLADLLANIPIGLASLD